MLYPVYVHKDKGSAYGLTFPDFPGCFSAADTLADIPRMAQEAVEVHFAGEDFGIPEPSAPERWEGDERFTGGYWLLLDIDLAKISTKPVRLNVSLPQNLVVLIDAFASEHHMSRSGFLAQAAKQAIARTAIVTAPADLRAEMADMVAAAVTEVADRFKGIASAEVVQPPARRAKETAA